MGKNYLIDKNLCHRCGICFYKDTDRVLEKDTLGYPVIKKGISVDKDKLLACCSGQKFDIPEQYKKQHPYNWQSPDIGIVDSCCIAWSNLSEFKKSGQSGGVISTLCYAALKMELVEAVLCVKRSDKDPFEAQYMAAKNADELLKATRSKYVVCSLLEGLHKIDSKKFGCVALPCQTQGLRLLQDPKIKENLKFIIGPFCGFNLEKTAGEYFCKLFRTNRKKIKSFENRGGHFPGTTTLRTDDTVYNIDRTFHRILYRTFVPRRCYTCVDYVNEFADISVGDALMHKNNKLLYPDGAAWTMIRTPIGKKVLDYCVEHDLLKVETQSLDKAQQYWKGAMVYRKLRAYNRILRYRKKNVAVPDYGINNHYLEKYRPVDRQFDLTLAIMKIPIVRGLLLRTYFFLAKTKNPKMKKLYAFISRRIFTHHNNAFPLLSIADTKKQIKNILTQIPLLKNLIILLGLRSAKNKSKKILISGGYGYKNTGDEAQLAFNLDFLRKNYPDHSITVLTPDKVYTQKEHNVDTEFAPRAAFFDSNISNHYSRSDKKFKLNFFIKLPRLLFNARLLHAGLPMFFVSGKEARLLQTINESGLLLLSGGGYLTGMTLSRLWDNMLLINIASRMNVPVIASGQTIGIFKDNISPILAKWGLKKLKQITVRDKSDSLNDLKSIGLTGSHISSTIDDALFCKSSSKERMNQLFKENNIPVEKPYIAVNVHYWGQDSNLSLELIDKISVACDKLCAEKYLNVIFLTMHPSDEKAAQNVIDKMTDRNVYLFKYDYDYRDIRGLIKNSVCCITMKHHPVVFACGEETPVISIVMDDYYEHKNKGALALFNLEDFLIRYSDNLIEDVLERVDYIIENRSKLKRDIANQLNKYKPVAGKAIKDYFNNL